MDNVLIKLRSDARKAGVPNYGSMSRSELTDALKGSKPNKRKSADAVVTKPKRKSATAVVADKPKRKPKRKAAVASSDMSEQRAKRIVRKYAGKRGRRPAEFYEAQAVLGEDTPQSKPAPKRKTTASVTKPKPKPARSSNGNGNAGRNLIDRSAIDWKADWTGGQTGNRGKIMKALRKFKGDYGKVLAALKPDVTKMYPKSSKTGAKYTKAEALAMLKWHIGRTAFDFVTGTHQHEKATDRKQDKRTSGRKAAPKASDNGNVSEYSDAKLKRMVKVAAGRRGRKSADVLAAIAELEKRAGGKGRAKVASSKPKPQASAGGRRKASTRKRVKA